MMTFLARLLLCSDAVSHNEFVHMANAALPALAQGLQAGSSIWPASNHMM
jgi:hypothetical protein